MSDVSYRALCFDLFGTLVEDDGRAVRGAIPFLATLPPQRWAIVTSASRRVAAAMLADAGIPQPSILITSDDVERNKPAPDGYRRAVQHLNVLPEDVLVVEDSLQGIAAAVAAGLDVVALQRGRSEAFARAATYVIPEFRDLAIVIPPDDAAFTFRLV